MATSYLPSDSFTEQIRLPGSHFTGNLAPTQLSLSLFDAHSPRQPSVSPASPAFSAPESYFTMHASYLIICAPELPRLPRKTVDRRTDGQTDGRTDGRTHGHTHTHTHTHAAITLRCACAQRGLTTCRQLSRPPFMYCTPSFDNFQGKKKA